LRLMQDILGAALEGGGIDNNHGGILNKSDV
jgi:hypothetical protein